MTENVQHHLGLAGAHAVARAISALAAGQVVVAWDAEGGRLDLVAAAEQVRAEVVNFMARHGRGLIYLVLPPAQVARLGLRPMVNAWSRSGPQLAVSIESRDVSTGISAGERAKTIRVAVGPDARPEDLISPGHVFPVRADPEALVNGGGRIEAALAAATLAGSPGGAVMTEILDDDGELAGWPHVDRLVTGFGLEVLTVEVLRRYARLADLGGLRGHPRREGTVSGSVLASWR